jgi:hypothetical protein
MRPDTRFLACFAAGAFVLAGSATAQQSLVWQDWEFEVRGEAVAVLSPGRDDAASVEAEVFLTDLKADLRAERVLENGAEIGVQLGGRVQLDHPQRSGFSGQVGGGVFSDTTLAPRGAFTGLTSGGEAEDSRVRAAFETAFVYIDGGYGELLAGRDIGVARRFHEGAESVFRRHTVINPSLDTSGLASVLTRNDLSGPAAKVSYSTPRLLGVKLGASYAPRANIRGLDRDPGRSVAGVDEPRLENIAEAAVNATRRLREYGTRISGYGAFSRADVETGPLRLDAGTVEVWSVGGRVERDGLSFGADWLTTDNAGGRYRAWSVSAAAEKFGFDWSASFGRSDDSLLDTIGRGASFGVSKRYFDQIRVGVGVQTQVLSPQQGATQRSTGPVIEMSLRY